MPSPRTASRTPASGRAASASTTRPRSEAVGASTIARGPAAPAASGDEPRPRSPASATTAPDSAGAPSMRNEPSARASTQRVLVRPSKRTRTEPAGERLSLSVTLPRRTRPSVMVTGFTTAPERTAVRSWVAKPGASKRRRLPSEPAASKRNVPSAFVIAACGTGSTLDRSSSPRPRPAQSVTVAPTMGPPRSSTTRPASAAVRPRRTSPTSSPAASSSRSSTNGAAPPPDKARRVTASAVGTATSNVPSGRVVPEASGFGRSSRRASRWAAAWPSSNGSTETPTLAAALPFTRTRPRISPAADVAASAVRTAAAGSRRRDMAVLPKERGTLLLGRSRGRKGLRTVR